MRVSSISNGVGLPPIVQAVAEKRASGRQLQNQLVIEGSQELSPPSHETVETGDVPIEPVVNGDALGLRFYQDKDAGVRVIQVVDMETGDIIRQIPPEEVVNFMRHFQEAKGHFVSRRY